MVPEVRIPTDVLNIMVAAGLWLLARFSKGKQKFKGE